MWFKMHHMRAHSMAFSEEKGNSASGGSGLPPGWDDIQSLDGVSHSAPAWFGPRGARGSCLTPATESRLEAQDAEATPNRKSFFKQVSVVVVFHPCARVSATATMTYMIDVI